MIIQIGTEADESRILWKHSESDEWQRADIEDLIDAYESRPTGEWIKSNLLPNGWHCSHCDSPVMTDDIEEMLFCPNCGAEMGGESDG